MRFRAGWSGAAVQSFFAASFGQLRVNAATLMNQSIAWSRITALLVIVIGIIWAALLMKGIWSDFAGQNVWKLSSSVTVLFVLAVVLHWVAKGPRAKTVDRP